MRILSALLNDLERGEFPDATLPQLNFDEVLIITSDHGCDPITPNTDHYREYALLICTSPQILSGNSLGIRKTFADNGVGATIAQLFGVPWSGRGTSFSFKFGD